jgi:predicted flap endonuclease-1-like 5' DNA nuclease
MRFRTQRKTNAPDALWALAALPVLVGLFWLLRRRWAVIPSGSQPEPRLHPYREPDSIPLDMSGYMDKKPAQAKQAQPTIRQAPVMEKSPRYKQQERKLVRAGDPPPDDLTRVSGIGPVVQGLLNQSGIRTFRQLANTPIPRLEEILNGAGLNRLSDPQSWPEQARLAAEQQWQALEALQQTIRETRRRRNSS